MTGTNIDSGNPQDGSNRLQGAVVLSGQLSAETTLRQLLELVPATQVQHGLFRILSKGVRGYIGIANGETIIGAHVTSNRSYGVKALRELLSADKGLYVFMSMDEHPIEVRQSLNLSLVDLLRWKEDAFAETPPLVEALNKGFTYLEAPSTNTEFGKALAQGLLSDTESADKEAFDSFMAWGGEAAPASASFNLNKITGSFKFASEIKLAPAPESSAPTSAPAGAPAQNSKITLTTFPQTSSTPVPEPQLIRPDSQAITAPQAFPRIPPAQPAQQSSAPAQQSVTDTPVNKDWTLADLEKIGTPSTVAASPAPGPIPPRPTFGASARTDAPKPAQSQGGQQVMDDLDRALFSATKDQAEAGPKPASAPQAAATQPAIDQTTNESSPAASSSRIRPLSKQDKELSELVTKTTAPMDRKAFLQDGPRQVMSSEQRRKFEITAIAGGIVGVGLFLALGQQVFNIVTGSTKYQTGLRALQSGDNVLAQVEMTAAIKLNGNANSLLYRGIAETRLGRLDNAMEDFNTVLRVNPKNQLALGGRAGLFLRQKKYEDVIIDADRMLKNQPNDATALRLRCLALAAKGEYKRALDDASNCLAAMSADERYDAQRAVVLSTRAYAYFKVNKFDEAIADYSKAIECDKANVHLYSSRATAYKRVKAYKKALEDAEMAIKLDPSDNTLYKLRGECYGGAGDAQKAAADLDTAVKIKPTLESFFARGEARLAAKDFSNAMEDFEYCLTVNPNNKLAKAKYDEARKNLYDQALHRDSAAKATKPGGKT